MSYRNRPRPAGLDLDAEPARPTPRRPIHPGVAAPLLQQRTPRSFDVSHTARLAEWLEGRGFYPIPRSAGPAELARYRRGGALVVLYGLADGAGSALCQGAAWESAAGELAELVSPEGGQP